MESHVKTFYDEKHKESRTEREQSSLIGLRKFNNFIKSVLIGDALEGVRGALVMDMCGGTGGDLAKFRYSRVKQVWLIDVSPSSVQEARRRHEGMPFQLVCVCGDAFNTMLVTAALGGARLDLVSCQFAFHYACSSDENVERVLQLVASVLRVGGKFVATFPNGRLIEQRISETGKWKTPDFFIERSDENSYFFTMAGAVERVPEYYVDMYLVSRLARKHGLALKYYGSFSDLYARASDKKRAQEVVPHLCDNLYVAMVLVRV